MSACALLRPCFLVREAAFAGLLLVMIGLLPSSVRAQEWEVFNALTAGFPSDNVSSLAEDAAGHVWVGTSFGLCEYDGSTWTVRQTTNSGLPGDVIKCLAVDDEDRLWVGTLLNGIGIFDGTSWAYYNSDNSPLPDNEINRITIDHRGWAWIGTYVGLLCYTGADWYLYNDSDTSHNGLRLNGNVVQDVQVRSDGLVGIATLNGGFHYLTDTSVLVLTTFDDNFPDNSQNSIVFDEVANERWMGTPSQGLLRHGGDWDNGPWFTDNTFNSNIQSNNVTAVKLNGSGGVWYGTGLWGMGLRQPNGAYITYSTTNSGLPDNTVNAIMPASDGSLWVGTGYGGAARLSFSDGVAEDQVKPWRVYPNPTDGPLWVELPPCASGTGWELKDACGRYLQGGRFSGALLQLDLEGLAPGMYHFGFGEMGQLIRRTVVRR